MTLKELKSGKAATILHVGGEGAGGFLPGKCVAAVASIRRELGGKWAVAVVVGQCVVAWIAAFLVRGVGLALGLG